MQQYTQPRLKWRLAKALRETICALGSCQHVSRYYYTVIYEVTEVVNGIDKCLFLLVTPKL